MSFNSKSQGNFGSFVTNGNGKSGKISNGKMSQNANNNNNQHKHSSHSHLKEKEDIFCPLCMELFDLDDHMFFPCLCGYQICRFCWHRIRTTLDSLCPACRKPYEENPAVFNPVPMEEIKKMKISKNNNLIFTPIQTKNGVLPQQQNNRNLSELRVVQKNLIFVIGLSSRLADPEILKKFDYFGKYGKIVKIVVSEINNSGKSSQSYHSAYITYSKDDEALNAILNINNISIDGRIIKVSLGTTKYCSNFLNNKLCNKVECMYLHSIGDANASFTKEEMQLGKHQDYEKKLIASILQNSSKEKENEENKLVSKEEPGRKGEESPLQTPPPPITQQLPQQQQQQSPPPPPISLPPLPPPQQQEIEEDFLDLDPNSVFQDTHGVLERMINNELFNFQSKNLKKPPPGFFSPVATTPFNDFVSSLFPPPPPPPPQQQQQQHHHQIPPQQQMFPPPHHPHFFNNNNNLHGNNSFFTNNNNNNNNNEQYFDPAILAQGAPLPLPQSFNNNFPAHPPPGY